MQSLLALSTILSKSKLPNPLSESLSIKQAALFIIARPTQNIWIFVKGTCQSICFPQAELKPL